MFKQISLLGILFFLSWTTLYAQSDAVIDSIYVNYLLEEVVIETNSDELYNRNLPSESLRLSGSLLKLPQNIQVLNGITLADQQIYSMADGVVRNVSGAARIEEWGDLYTYITMRGSRAASFRNGMNVSHKYGLLSEDMSFVDRVEFVKGPSSFMFSNGEPSGIYNVVTKRPADSRSKRVSMGVGSYGLYRATLDLDGNLDKSHKLLYRFNIAGQSNNAFRDYESTKRLSIAPVVSYQLAKSTLLTAEYLFQFAKLPDLGVSNLFSKEGYADVRRKSTLSDPQLESTYIRDQNITLNLQHQFKEDWKLTSQLSYFNYKQQGSFIWAKSLDDAGNLQRIQYIWDAKNEMKFGQVYLNGAFKTGAVSHHLLSGIDLSDKSYVADFAQSHLLDSIGTYNIYKQGYQAPYYGTAQFDRSRGLKERVGNSFLLESQVIGVYVQDELGFMDDRLRLSLSGRFSSVRENNYGTITTNRKFTPRLGLNYSITSSTALYALFDQSFVPQSGRLRSGGVASPLTANNYEIGWKKDWFGGCWNTSLVLYQIDKRNQTSADPDNVGGENYVLQFGKTRTQGVEFDVKGELFRGMKAVVNYAYTHAKVTQTTSLYKKGEHVPGYATHTLNAWLNYQFQEGVFKDFGISLGMVYMGDRNTWWNGVYGGKQLPNYLKFDGALSWSNDRLSIHLNVYNLADRYLYSGAYHSSGWYYWRPEPPRNFRLSLAYQF